MNTLISQTIKYLFIFITPCILFQHTIKNYNCLYNNVNTLNINGQEKTKMRSDHFELPFIIESFTSIKNHHNI